MKSGVPERPLMDYRGRDAPLRRWLEARLEGSRDALETQGMDEIQTAGLRAEVALIREMLRLGDPRPEPDDSE